MIQVLCCDHVVQELIKCNVLFKFPTKFGHCDCESHREILVGKCYKNDFFISVFTVQKNVSVQKNSPVAFALSNFLF